MTTEIARKERQKWQHNESMTSESSPEHSDDSFEDMVVNKCFKCNWVFEPTDDLKMKAAGCDKCWHWYHVKCTPKYVRDMLDDETSLEDIYFECDYC